MNRNKLYFGLLMLALVVVIVGTAYEMLDAGKEEKSYTVSVIVDDSNNERWIAMREGLEQAARDYNITMNYVFSGKFGSEREEMELIEREIQSGTDGLILQMISDNLGLDKLGQDSPQVAVMLLETDVEPQGIYAVTGPDNKGIGITLGETAATESDAAIKEKKVGILAGDQAQIAMGQRLEGVKSALEKEGAEPLWTLWGNAQETGEMLEEKVQTDPVDILIALGNEETELAVDFLLTKGEEEKGSCLLYGVGYSEKAVYYLDKGWIKSLVVPNEFNMGYLSMEQIARQIQYRLSEVESREIDYLVIDQENLYEEENQKVLFPIVQ